MNVEKTCLNCDNYYKGACTCSAIDKWFACGQDDETGVVKRMTLYNSRLKQYIRQTNTAGTTLEKIQMIFQRKKVFMQLPLGMIQN